MTTEREGRRHKATAAIYDELTDGLRRRPAGHRARLPKRRSAIPISLPTRAEIDAEREHVQKDKPGLEIDQGDFVADVLADPQLGLHLMHAMSQPRAEALARIDDFRRTGPRRPRPDPRRPRRRDRPRHDPEPRVPELGGRRRRPRRSRRPSTWCCSTTPSTSACCGARRPRTRSTKGGASSGRAST